MQNPTSESSRQALTKTTKPYKYSLGFNVFSQAYKAGLTDKNYVWIMMSWASVPGWPDKLDPVWGTPPSSSCTNKELHLAAEGYLSLDQKYISDSPEKTISGMVSLAGPGGVFQSPE